MTASPTSGAHQLQLGPALFEIRWGRGGEFGIQQVNLRSRNTRDVKAEVAMRPGGPKRTPSFIESGFSSRTEYEKALAQGMAGMSVAHPTGPPAKNTNMSVAHAHWYWQEDSHMISKHDSSDVKPNTNWVRYAGNVCAELDDFYAKFVGAEYDPAYAVHPLDLTDRIASTGTEMKANNAHTGCAFSVDFEKMEQKNVKSGFTRKMLREEFQAAAPIMPDISEPAPGPMQVNVTVAAPPQPQMGRTVPIDYNGDGVPDAFGVDTTGDGQINHILPVGAPGMGGPPMGGPPMGVPPGAPGGQKMKVAVPPGLKGGMSMQVNTPAGLMNVPIPDGLEPGAEFEFMM